MYECVPSLSAGFRKHYSVVVVLQSENGLQISSEEKLRLVGTSYFVVLITFSVFRGSITDRTRNGSNCFNGIGNSTVDKCCEFDNLLRPFKKD